MARKAVIARNQRKRMVEKVKHAGDLDGLPPPSETFQQWLAAYIEGTLTTTDILERLDKKYKRHTIDE